MLSVIDLRAFLSGSWQVHRSLLDQRHGLRGEFRGQAHFISACSCLIYEERGTLNFGAHHGSAEQRYRFDFHGGNARASVSFRDGRAFHDLDLTLGEALVSHTCGADLYEGRFTVLDATQWKSVWKIAGPRKDQAVLSLYTRLP